MHEVTLSVTRCSSESASVVADRPQAMAPWGMHMPGLGHVAARHTLKRPSCVPTLTRFPHSLLLCLSCSRARSSKAERCHRHCRTSTELARQRHHAIIGLLMHTARPSSRPPH